MKTIDDVTPYLLRQPTAEEMNKINCDQSGVIGHTLCGWCTKHDRPRLVCKCPAKRVTR